MREVFSERCRSISATSFSELPWASRRRATVWRKAWLRPCVRPMRRKASRITRRTASGPIGAYRRIGLTHGRSHALRHTVARRLLAQGSSLKEVADVLRHRSLNTSLIYAKLDSRRLLAVALPWPGSSS